MSQSENLKTIPDDLPLGSDQVAPDDLGKTLSPMINKIAEELIKFQGENTKNKPERWQYFERVFINCSHAFNIMVDYFGQLLYIKYNLDKIVKNNEDSIEEEFKVENN